MANIGKYQFPGELIYDRAEHLWLRREGDEVLVGLDALVLDMVGELVHVDLPPVGTRVAQGDALGSLEAEKMVRTLKAPLAGEIVAHNTEALSRPLDIRNDPYGAGWLVRIRPDDWRADAPGFVTGEAPVSVWVEAEMALLEMDGR